MAVRLDPRELCAVLASLPSDRATPATVFLAAKAMRPELTEGAVATSLAGGEAAGHVEFYDHPVVREKHVFLTPLGASLACVHLNTSSSAWVADGDPEERNIQPRQPRFDEAPVSELFRDIYAYAPVDRVIAFDQEDLFFPASLILLGLTEPAPMPTVPPKPLRCPLHPGRLPKWNEYCLWCDSESSPAERIRAPRGLKFDPTRKPNA